MFDVQVMRLSLEYFVLLVYFLVHRVNSQFCT